MPSITLTSPRTGQTTSVQSTLSASQVRNILLQAGLYTLTGIDAMVEEFKTKGGGVEEPATGAVGPYTRWLQTQQRGDPAIGSAAERYQRGEFTRLQDLYTLQAPIYRALGREQQPTFGTFAGQFPTVAARRGRGQDILKSMLGMTGQERVDAGFTYEPSYGEEGGASWAGGADLENLQELLATGLRASSGRGAGFIGSRVPFLLQQWESAGQPGGSFIDYLKGKFGLASSLGLPVDTG